MTSASDEKWRFFNFFSRAGLRTYQHPCNRPELQAEQCNYLRQVINFNFENEINRECTEIVSHFIKRREFLEWLRNLPSEKRIWFMKVASHVTYQSSVHPEYGWSAIQTQQIVISVS